MQSETKPNPHSINHELGMFRMFVDSVICEIPYVRRVPMHLPNHLCIGDFAQAIV